MVPIDRSVLDSLVTDPHPLTVRERDALRALMEWADKAPSIVQDSVIPFSPAWWMRVNDWLAAWPAKEQGEERRDG